MQEYTEEQQKELQKIFDKTKKHLLTQNRKAQELTVVYDDVLEMQCRYRTKCGDMCAFGIHIPDAVYDKSLEGKPIGLIWDKLNGLFPNYQKQLFTQLQGCHDAYPVDMWPKQLKQIAELFNLKYEQENTNECC